MNSLNKKVAQTLPVLTFESFVRFEKSTLLFDQAINAIVEKF
jgi:hypothetical protein